VQVWQISIVRRLRLGEKKRNKKKEEERRRKKKKRQGKNIVVGPIP